MTNDSSKSLSPEVFEAYLIGRLSDGQVQLLEQRLREDPAARRQLAEAMQVMSLVRQEFAGRAEYQSANQDQPLLEDFNTLLKELGEHEAAAETVAFPVQSFSEDQQEEDAGSLSTQDLVVVGRYVLRKVLTAKPVILGAAAAIVLLATVCFINWGGLYGDIAEQPTEFESPAFNLSTVATLTASSDAKWLGPDLQVGDGLKPGERLRLIDGFAQITTERGAVVILEAPAAIEWINNNALYLHTGKLVGLCHTPSSQGFVVKTDYTDITDLGTEFGVAATPDGVEAAVFVGEIAVKTPGTQTRVVTHSQTARVSINEDQPTLEVVDTLANGYARRLPREPLVTAAFINDDRFKVEVAPQSCYEDSKVHTDREHEINGLDAQGLPAELLGADVILTPGDARPNIVEDTAGLQIEIETSRPAQVYLLYSDGAQPPDWVLRDYIKTEMRAGLDFDVSRQSLNASVGVGPGQSIDRVQRVWRRKQPIDGRGIVGKRMTGHSAYILLAVPIQETP
jgi:ferric-dicitrate binding protein FerR (iron transport regulator)